MLQRNIASDLLSSRSSSAIQSKQKSSRISSLVQESFSSEGQSSSELSSEVESSPVIEVLGTNIAVLCWVGSDTFIATEDVVSSGPGLLADETKGRVAVGVEITADGFSPLLGRS